MTNSLGKPPITRLGTVALVDGVSVGAAAAIGTGEGVGDFEVAFLTGSLAPFVEAGFLAPVAFLAIFGGIKLSVTRLCFPQQICVEFEMRKGTLGMLMNRNGQATKTSPVGHQLGKLLCTLPQC